MRPRSKAFFCAIGAVLQHVGEFHGESRFHRQAASDGALAILRAAQQRHPIVVEVADIFVGQVVDAVAQIALHPGMLRLAEGRQQRVFDQALGLRARESRTRTATVP